MINILLDAYIAEFKMKKKISWIHLIIAIVSTIFSAFFLIWYELKNDTLLAIISLALIIVLYIDIALWEKESLKQYQIRFEEYNKRLDKIKDILKGLNYNNKNWYSPKKIQYLIQSGEAYIEEHKNTNIKLFDLGKTIILPIIVFVANVISNNAEIATVLGITIIVSIILVISLLLAKIISSVADLIFRSSSINEIKTLILLLKALYSRDFDQSF